MPSCMAAMRTRRRIWRSSCGAAEIARDPAVDAEVDHGGEGPDILGCGKKAVHSGDSGDGEVDGKSKVLVVQEGGDGEDGSSEPWRR